MFKEVSKRFNSEAQNNYDFAKAGLRVVAGVTYQKDDPKTYGTSSRSKSESRSIAVWRTLQLEKTLPAKNETYFGRTYKSS